MIAWCSFLKKFQDSILSLEKAKNNIFSRYDLLNEDWRSFCFKRKFKFISCLKFISTQFDANTWKINRFNLLNHIFYDTLCYQLAWIVTRPLNHPIIHNMQQHVEQQYSFPINNWYFNRCFTSGTYCVGQFDGWSCFVDTPINTIAKSLCPPIFEFDASRKKNQLELNMT